MMNEHGTTYTMDQTQSHFSVKAAVGWTLLLFVGTQITIGPLIMMVIFFAMGYPFPSFLTDANFLLGATVIAQAFSIYFLYLLLKRKNIDIKNYLRLGTVGGKEIGLMLLGFIVASGAVEIVSNLLDIEPNQMMMDLITNGHIVLVFFTLTVFAALSEELFFRGLLFKELEVRYGGGITIAVTSLGFALAHALQYQLAEVGLVVLLAVVMGYIRYKWQNIYIPIGVHFLNNFMSFVFFFYVYE